MGARGLEVPAIGVSVPSRLEGAGAGRVLQMSSGTFVPPRTPATCMARPSRNQTAGPPDSTQRPQRVSKSVAEETCSLRNSAPASAVLSPNFVAFGGDFFNAEDAKVDAEFRRNSFPSATLSAALSDLCVESGWLHLWLRFRRAMPLRQK